jgi:mannose-1-phosphate guanylyltransferase/mannose-6-phosphate isomerase
LSRELFPKQLLPLVGDRTMLQETLIRLDGLENVAPPLVICNDEHRFLVAEQLREIGVEPLAIILEPVGRNTAPAVAVAAAKAAELLGTDEDPVLLVLPADHVIRDVAGFHAAIEHASALASEGALVTFGVLPTAPETGYGYIRAGKPEDGHAPVREFVEKPDSETARAYLDAGGYYWNSGMFMFLADRYVAELREYRPDIVSACVRSVAEAREDLDFIRLDRKAFEACPADSIDYAVMEKTDHGKVVPIDVGWSDVGSWSALHEAAEADELGNVVVGDVLVEDTRDCYLYAGSRLVATVGLSDAVVVETADAVLVAPRGRAQDVKRLVGKLKASGRDEPLLHRKVVRPWGSYDSVDAGERFQVKRIVVNPGAQLSLQMHHHRAEHWIVVQGTARVTRGEDSFILGENESTYIPVGTTHRLENPGKLPLHLIEVQSGTYLGEDDIVRFEDTYGRADEG